MPDDSDGKRVSAGQELIKTLSQLTGLEEATLRAEIERILHSTGKKRQEELTLEELRSALMVYLQALNAKTDPDSALEEPQSSDFEEPSVENNILKTSSIKRLDS